MEILFCDTNSWFTDACDRMITENEQLLKFYKFTVENCDIRDIDRKRAAYVSPANSFGSMGGGIDEIYSRVMFPGIQKTVMDKIGLLETKTELPFSFDHLKQGPNKPYLPIGQAIITTLNEYPGYETCYLITAPTMIYPTEILGTDNPYKAMLACLEIIKNHDIDCLVVCGLGTGVGFVPEQESAKQIFRALNDFNSRT